jgi:hypothetical protein
MNLEQTARIIEMTTDTIAKTLPEGGGVVVLAVTEDATGFITHYAGLNTPRSMAHMALTLLRQAHDDLTSRDQSTPLDQDDEALLTNLTDTINDLEFYAEPEAAA